MIVAADERDQIGHAGQLPWHLPDDLKRFKRLTSGHVVVAGRLTHQSIVDRLGHPLPDRFTIVVTHDKSLVDSDDVRYRNGIEQAFESAETIEPTEVFVIGGAEIYRAAMPRVQRVYLTRVFGRHDGDTALDPGWLDGFAETEQEPATEEYQFLTYDRA